MGESLSTIKMEHAISSKNVPQLEIDITDEIMVYFILDKNKCGFYKLT